MAIRQWRGRNVASDDPNGATSGGQAPGLLRRLDATGVPLLLGRLIVGGVFVYLGYLKIQAPQEFLKVIKEFEILPLDPPELINSVAVLLPWLEVFCGLCLLLGIFLRGASFTLLVSLIVFTAAVALRALGIYQAEEIAFCAIKFDCGCGTGEVFICSKLLENTGLILACFPVLFSRSRRFCLGGKRPTTPDPATAAA